MSTAELLWFKSSYSDSSEVDDCVELALTWHKSSYSSSSNGNGCIRDSKSTEGPCLTVAPATWTAFITYSARTQ
ncbi:DUF397 domain-containing protein [Streptomyces sp. SID4946]|uniref:DUF397 domain-containing protein n=1 Tax=Streptomyces TaxID=1883 RepID=UPI00081DEEF3|nr:MULTISPECIES: DUF397 domain-containing protein [unclassified Streptomyces]MYQ92429.1 DUF397 domain-containing protein [Streptomyces sp. SID4946]SCF74111.1 protein of unknown function [Streptomyces sp. DconLS]SCF95660.1 protein of unknown function [Streptomyces sp. LamerLS-31b]